MYICIINAWSHSYFLLLLAITTATRKTNIIHANTRIPPSTDIRTTIRSGSGGVGGTGISVEGVGRTSISILASTAKNVFIVSSDKCSDCDLAVRKKRDNYIYILQPSSNCTWQDFQTEVSKYVYKSTI